MIVRFIKFCGEHPFATGLFAILSVIGLFYSIVSDQQSTARELQLREQLKAQDRLLEEQSQALRKQSDTIEIMASAECSNLPCWTIENIGGGRLLKRTKTTLDQKLPPPGMKDEYGWHYNLEGCRFSVVFVDDEVIFYEMENSTNCRSERGWVPHQVNGQVAALGDVRVDDFRIVFESGGYSRVTYSGGCIEACPGRTEAHAEFKLSGTGVFLYDSLVFTGGFWDKSKRLKQMFIENQTAGPKDRLWNADICHSDVTEEIFNALGEETVWSVGYWSGVKDRGDYGKDTTDC